MSIQPIDLQTLFSQLNQVGKEQALIKGQETLQQTIQGKELEKQTEQNDHSVNNTKDTDEGPADIREDEQNQQQEENRKKQEREKEKKKVEYFKDPDLGNNVDISG